MPMQPFWAMRCTREWRPRVVEQGDRKPEPLAPWAVYMRAEGDVVKGPRALPLLTLSPPEPRAGGPWRVRKRTRAQRSVFRRKRRSVSHSQEE